MSLPVALGLIPRPRQLTTIPEEEVEIETKSKFENKFGLQVGKMQMYFAQDGFKKSAKR
jgi:hypothetical protein